MIEQFLYKTQRANKGSFIAHVSQFQHLRREFLVKLGEKEVCCVYCNQKWTEQNDFPDAVLSYLLKRSAYLDAEERKGTSLCLLAAMHISSTSNVHA